MLVLARTPKPQNDTINIYCPNGDVVQVKLVEHRGKASVIGIDAPLNYRISRAELVQIDTVGGYPHGMATVEYSPRTKELIGGLSPSEVAELSVA